MTSSISSNSNIKTVNWFNANNAFKAAKTKPQQEKVQEPIKEFKEDITTNEQENNSILAKFNLDEIKKFAKNETGDELSNEDIKYALTFGRSVIVDYTI